MFIAILHVRLRALAIAALPVFLAWTATRLGPMENPVGWTARSFGDSAPAIWHLEEDIAVESPDGEPFVGLLVDDRGRMFIRSNRPDRVWIYGPEGEPRGSFGGPSEDEDGAVLDDVRGMTWGPDGELWVVEGDRFVAFDASGRFLRDVPRRSNANARRWDGAGFDDAGSLYDKGYAGGAHDPVLLRLSPAGEVADTIRLPFLQPRYFSPGDQIRLPRSAARSDSPRAVAVARAGYPLPHSPAAIWAFDPRGALWVARTDAYRVHRRQLDGDTLTTVEREVRPRSVSSEEKLEIQRRMERQGEAPDTARIPSRKPILESLHADRDGRLWVRLATGSGSPTVYDVFDRDGVYLARVETGVRISTGPPVAHGDTLYYVGSRPGSWPPPEPGDFGPITNHAVRARLVETADGADGAGDAGDTIRSASDPAAAVAQTPTDVARSFWNAWARSDTTVMRRLSTGLVAFTPGARARIDSVIVEETGSTRVGEDRVVVPTRLGMSAGRSSFEISFQTTLVGEEGRWRVEQLETTRALALAYLEVMAGQLRRAGEALEEVREDTAQRES